MPEESVMYAEFGKGGGKGGGGDSVRQGDWFCAACQNHCFGFRSHCKRCGLAKGEEPGGQHASAAAMHGGGEDHSRMQLQQQPSQMADPYKDYDPAAASAAAAAQAAAAAAMSTPGGYPAATASGFGTFGASAVAAAAPTQQQPAANPYDAPNPALTPEQQAEQQKYEDELQAYYAQLAEASAPAPAPTPAVAIPTGATPAGMMGMMPGGATPAGMMGMMPPGAAAPLDGAQPPPQDAAAEPTVPAAAAAAADAPLPLAEGWVEHPDPSGSGKSYFFNESTQETTWERPEAAPLPPGWVEQPDPAGSGKSYFFNESTQETTWERPVLAPLPPGWVEQPDPAGSGKSYFYNEVCAVRC